MTRRKLSDVLRQEVTKDAADNGFQGEVVDNAAQTSSSTRTRKTTNAGTTESGAKNSGTLTPDTSAEQASQIKELKAALLQGAAQEKELQSQIKSLQVEVTQKQEQIETLTQQMTQVDQLKTELAEAKTMILQLSAANTPTRSKTPEPQKKQPQGAKSTKTLMPLTSIPYHSVQHGPSQPSKPKSVDVGWMD